MPLLLSSKSAKDLTDAQLADALLDFASKVYSLSYSTRYSMYKKLHNESVAEHSYYVTLFVYALHEHYEFDLLAALKMAIVHDLPEIAVSDVNHNVKRAYPEISRALREAEYKFVTSQLPTDMSAHFITSNDDSVESYALHLADVLSVRQWVDNELAMGNNSVRFVLDEANKRITMCMHKLESSRR